MGKKLFFLLIFVLVICSNAYAVSLRVSVTNVSNDEKLSDYPFTIKIVNPKKDGTSETVKSFSFDTDSSGFFEGNVDESSGKAIIGELNYRGIGYSSPLIEIEDKQKKYTMDILVFDITDNMENVAVSQRTMFASPLDEKTIQVFERLTIENKGNFSYVGKFNETLDTHQVLYIPVPQGYGLTNVQGIDARKIFTFNRGIVTQEEIVPGEKEILFGYSVRSDTGFFDFSLFSEKDSPLIKNLSFLFQKNDDWKVSVPRFKLSGERTFFGQMYNTWKGKARSVVRIKVYGPTFKGIFDVWAVSLSLAFVASGILLFLGKDKIYLWHLKKEKGRLEGILSRLKDEADKEDLRGYYLPFKQTLENRLREIEQRMKV